MSGSDGDLVSGAGLHPQGRVPGAVGSFDTLRGAVGERYGLVRELRRGGTGVVFLAREKARHRYLAVKLVALPAAPERRARFLHQVRAAARLSHPNIVPIHAVEQVGDSVLLAMPYVDGETLAERVRAGGPLPVGEATRILYQVGRGVAHARCCGVVHGDLNPNKIMIARGSGRAMVMGFGTGALRAAATSPFMSPERMRGAPADDRSDVYALGVTAYYAVTGYLPSDGDTAAEPAPWLAVYNKNLDGTYSRVVRKCLQPDPDRRFWGAADLFHALAEAPELGRDVPAPLRSFAEELRWYGQSSAHDSVLATAGLVALVSGAWTSDPLWAAIGGVVLVAILGNRVKDLRTITRMALAMGYSREDMVHAVKVDMEREGRLTVFDHPAIPTAPLRRARRLASAALGLAGAGAAAGVVGSLPRAVGALALIAGIVTALTASVWGFVYGLGQPDRIGEFWLRFWQSRAGEWTVRLAGWRFEVVRPWARSPRSRKMQHEHLAQRERMEAMRELLNQTPAMRHLAASRIERIRGARLNESG